MELTRVLGPRMMRVLWGHWVHTRLCSPSRILRMFSDPVTRMTGFPRRWVLNTLPWRSLREMWKLEPCSVKIESELQVCHISGNKLSTKIPI